MKKSLQSFIALFLVFALVFPVVPMGHLPVEAAPISAFSSANVRTWGTQFAISSAAEWSGAQSATSTNALTTINEGIIIDANIGFASDPTVSGAAYQRDERGALMLAPGTTTAVYETLPFLVDHTFNNLNMSWGADTPNGTWIEVSARTGYAPNGDMDNIRWNVVTPPNPIPGHLATTQISGLNRTAGFLTFGRWSPFTQTWQQGIRHTTSTPVPANVTTQQANMAVGTIRIGATPGGTYNPAFMANVVQLRVTLHRNDTSMDSPVVRHVHGSTRNTFTERDVQNKDFPQMEFPARTLPGGQVVPGGNTARFPDLASIDAYLRTRPIELDRSPDWRGNRHPNDNATVISPGVGTGIYLQGFPMHSQQARGPIEGGVICSPTTIGMLINGFWELEGRNEAPMLIEEFSMRVFDHEFNGYGNWQFTVGIAGTYGLRAHVEHYDRLDGHLASETIKRHLLSGHALGASVRFSASPSAPNFLPRTDGTTTGHLIAILGVVWRNNVEYLIVYEPWANNPYIDNSRVYREIPMSNFMDVLRYTGTVLYVVKPGIEPLSATENTLPNRVHADLVETDENIFRLAVDGEQIVIDSTPRPRPNGYIAWTTVPDIVFSGPFTTRFNYLPVRNPNFIDLSRETMENPNFRMFVIMGNGITYVVDNTSVPQLDNIAALESPGGEFMVNNDDALVAPGSIAIAVDVLTIGELRAGLNAMRDGTFKIFPAGTTVDTIDDFHNLAELDDADYVAGGIFIVVLSANGEVMRRFSIDYLGLGFARSTPGATITLNMFDFVDGPNWQPWNNPLTGWEGYGRTVTYTIQNIPSDATHAQLLSIADTANGIGSVPVRFVEPGANGFIQTRADGTVELFPTSETGHIMPWRAAGFSAVVTATVTSPLGDADPFHNAYRSFSVQINGGTEGVRIPLGTVGTDGVVPSFRWGTFDAPALGGVAYNLTFCATRALDGPIVNRDATGTAREAATVPFPYTPNPLDRPYFIFETNWAGLAYNNATTHTRIDWYHTSRIVANRLPNGYEFGSIPGRTYIAELVLCMNMHPRNQNLIFTPQGGAFAEFVNNIYGLPVAGQNGLTSITANHGDPAGGSGNWNITFVMTFDPLNEGADHTLTIENNPALVTSTYVVGQTASGSHYFGDIVNINAGTRQDYIFDGWTVTNEPNTSVSTALATAGETASFMMPDGPVTIVANWVHVFDIRSFPLTVLANSGGFTENVSGMFEEGETVSVLATATDGYVFSHWQAAITAITLLDDTANPLVFDMPANEVVLFANFERITPQITDIIISPAAIEVQAGAVQQFGAAVLGTNNPSQGVSWSIEDATNAVITTTGLLVVDSGVPPGTEIIVTATSLSDSSVFASAIVTVVDDTPEAVQGILLMVSENVNLSSAAYGYSEQQAFHIPVVNIGNQETGALTVSITGDIDAFVLSHAVIDSIGVGDYEIFAVRAATGLPVGTYTATITIDTQSFTVSFIVNPAFLFPIGFTTNNVTRNGILATGTVIPTDSAAEGEEVTVTVDLTGTTAATGTNTIALTSATGVEIEPVHSFAVVSGDALSTELTFTFTMPAGAVADLVVVHTFTPANVTQPTQPLPAPTGLNISDRVLSWNAVNNAAAYHVYINGSRVAVVNAPATSFNLATLGLAAGTHTVQVRAIGSGNFTNSGLSSSLTLTITAPPAEPDPGPPSVGTGNWSPSAPAQQNQAASPARQNHTNIQNQITTLAAADVAGTPAVIMSVAANNELALQGSSLAALVQANAPLVVRSANGIFEVLLPTSFLNEFHSRGLTNGEFVISIVYVEDSGALVAGEFEFIARNNVVARFQNSYTITANLESRIPTNMNRARITGVHNERNLGGSFSRGSRFELDTNMTGTFAIAHVNTLRRISVALDSYVVTDLAGNAPTQTMDVLPVIQNDRTLLPIRFMAYALGAEVEWNNVTSEVTLTLDGEVLTFAIGQMAPGMDVPAQIMQERTMVPLRFISEFFGAVVLWDDASRSIEIVR